jgi:putative ABC transport system permease protein
MHEIGIRKAIGATRRQIAGQFMSEAAVLATGGALVGVAVSYLVMYILRVTTQLQPIITWQAAVFVAGLAIVVGILFSVIPAVKAASKDPIAALRHE